MDDLRVGAAIRAVRIRRGWRQADVAQRAGSSVTAVSRVERGQLDGMPLATLRRIAAALDIRVDLVPRWRGADLDRLLNAGHAEMHEWLARYFDRLPGWVRAPEVSFAVFGERGVIDILAWHPGRRALLVIELKTELVDVNELVGVMDRRRRLAARIGRERGWDPATVSVWVVIADTPTNRRRHQRSRGLLRSAFPVEGHAMRAWMHDPGRAVAGLSFWSDGHRVNAGRRTWGVKRVHRARRLAAMTSDGQQAHVRQGAGGVPA